MIQGKKCPHNWQKEGSELPGELKFEEMKSKKNSSKFI